MSEVLSPIFAPPHFSQEQDWLPPPFLCRLIGLVGFEFSFSMGREGMDAMVWMGKGFFTEALQHFTAVQMDSVAGLDAGEALSLSSPSGFGELKSILQNFRHQEQPGHVQISLGSWTSKDVSSDVGYSACLKLGP